MYYQRKATGRRAELGNLSDEEILSGFREGDADIIREYFYGYCQVGYNIFRKRILTLCRWLISMPFI